MTIRRAMAQDAPAIQATIRAVYDEYGFPWYPDSYHRDLYDFEGYYLSQNIPFWVAEHEGGVVGTTALMFHPYIEGQGVVLLDGTVRVAGTDASLERVYVHPSARRMGIARNLNQTALEEARARACRGIEIWSDKSFVAA
ncbi:MAG: hypothetical protein C4320_01365, partial [Armatimonadota bacterium]